MKTTTCPRPFPAEHKVIVYDDTCPMCSLYTKAFVQTGMLKAENRIGFSQLEHNELIGALDPVRSRHEIPLLDREGGATLYGVDALVYILRQRLPFIAWAMKVPGVAASVRELYAVISYNRRVIIPSSGRTTGVDCTPDFHTGYRLIFIAFALLFLACAVLLFLLVGFGLPFTTCMAMLVPVYSALALHGAIAYRVLGKSTMEYAGHSAVTLILFALPTLVAVGISTITGWPAVTIAGAVLGSFLLLWQHYKRMLYLGRSRWWSAVWFLTLTAGIAVACILRG